MTTAEAQNEFLKACAEHGPGNHPEVIAAQDPHRPEARSEEGRIAMTIFNGFYTITNPETGNHRTFRLRTQKDDAVFAPGKRVLSLLTGPDNSDDYTGFAFVNDDGRVFVWGSKRGAGDAGPSKWERLADCFAQLTGAAWAPYYADCSAMTVQVSKRCNRCNRHLTDPVSIETGYGPECRKHVAA